ncbi:tautomerase family protein [Streptomyces sp. NPDC091279]|uniref:tautomerase family protein n=1 Tax=Streptomyces sp. NPDC091279 TaxID=3365983 RepID=UPI00381E3286
MPHVTIKHFPYKLTEPQKAELAEELTRTITRFFEVDDGAVSVAVEPVAQADWNDRVVSPELVLRAHLLIKNPTYLTS